MLRLADSRIIAPTEGSRLELACSVLTRGSDYGLLAFRAVDTHVHIEAACSERDAYQFARRVESSFGRKLALPVGFERARVKPVRDQRHLSNLFDYCMRQEEHHGSELDPKFSGSNLPDLLGMRLLGRYTVEQLRQMLPRKSRALLLRYLSCERLDDATPCLSDLAESAAAAFAVPALVGRGKKVIAARRAAVHLMNGHASLSDIGRQLSLPLRALRFLLRQRPRPEELAAVRMQMQLRAGTREATFAVSSSPK